MTLKYRRNLNAGAQRTPDQLPHVMTNGCLSLNTGTEILNFSGRVYQMILFSSRILIRVTNNQCLGIELKQKNNMRHGNKIRVSEDCYLDLEERITMFFLLKHGFIKHPSMKLVRSQVILVYQREEKLSWIMLMAKWSLVISSKILKPKATRHKDQCNR